MSCTAIRVIWQGIRETRQWEVFRTRKQREAGSLRRGWQKIMYPLCVPKMPSSNSRAKKKTGLKMEKEEDMCVQGKGNNFGEGKKNSWESRCSKGIGI